MILSILCLSHSAVKNVAHNCLGRKACGAESRCCHGCGPQKQSNSPSGIKKPTVARCSPGMFRARIDGHFPKSYSQSWQILLCFVIDFICMSLFFKSLQCYEGMFFSGTVYAAELGDKGCGEARSPAAWAGCPSSFSGSTKRKPEPHHTPVPTQGSACCPNMRA